MVSSYTTNKAFEKPANGDYVDTWNIPVNGDWDIADKAFGGTYSVALTNANVNLTQANCQNVRIRLTGSLSGNIIIYFPASVSGFFIVQNATSGAYSVTLASAGGSPGTTVLTEQGRVVFVFTDGSNVFYADDSRIQLTAGNGIQITGTTNLTISLVTPVAVANGGTGQTSYTVGDLIYASGATTLSKLADVVTGNALISGGVGVAPSWGKIGLTTHVTGTLPAANGGTGIASYTVGDIIYASGSSTLAALPDVATGNALISGGVGVAPSWGKVGLTTHISGVLGIANGGTGQSSATAAFDALSPTTTRGDLIARGVSNNVRVAIGAANTSLLSNGTDPVWGQVSLTAGVTGTLPIANGGTNATTATTAFNNLSPTTNRGDLIYRGATNNVRLAVGTNNQVLLSNGTDPVWGQVSLTGGITGVLPVANGGTGVTSSTGTGSVVLSASPTLSGTVTTSQINAGSYIVGDAGIRGTHISGTGYSLRARANSTDSIAYLQFTNFAESAQWGSIESTSSAGINITTPNTATINGATILTTANTPIPSGTRMIFQQTAAPTGWVKETGATFNESAMRIVTGGVSTGGSLNFSSAFSTRSFSTVTEYHTLSEAEMPSHTHVIGRYNGRPVTGSALLYYSFEPGAVPSVTSSEATGGNQGHRHGMNWSEDWNVKFVDFIIATKS